MSTEQCGNCKFYDLKERQTLYEDDPLNPIHLSRCRRYPPKRMCGGKSLHSGFGLEFELAEHQYPLVEDYWWCGEWRADGEAS